MNTSIASTFAGCLEEYERLLYTLTEASSPLREQLSLSTVQDEFGRLKVWAGNIAAHKTGRSSLDFRLRDATPLRERIIALLTDMTELLQDATCIASGTRIPRDNADFESDSDTDSSDGGSTGFNGTLTATSSAGLTTELQEIFKDIVVVIDCLYKLSMSIRNGVSAHDRLVKADTIDTSFFESWDIEHVKTKFPATKDFLASRLGKSISRRRQYFKYCERHHKKLAQDLFVQKIPAPILSSFEVAVAEVPETLNNDNEAVTNDIEPTFDHSKLEIEHSVAATTVLTQTTASEFTGCNNDFEVDSDSGQTSTSYATTASFGGRLVIPPPPRESTDGRPFECPYCYTIVSIRNSHAWKKHIFRDLQPYVCTFDACGKAGKLFDTQRDWWDHELLNHRKEWFCTADCQHTFKIQSEFEGHMRDTHAITSNHQLGALVDMCHRPVDENAEEQCPLCAETLDSMKQLCRHLARHLQELALFALPRHKDEEDTDDFDSDKPQPSNFSRDLSDGSLSFASDSLRNDPTSKAGDDDPINVEEGDSIRSNVTSEAGLDAERGNYLEAIDIQLDDNPSGTGKSIQEDVASVVSQDMGKAGAMNLLEDFDASTTPKLPSEFLPLFYQHIARMLNGTDDTLISRDDDFVRLFTDVAQMLPGQDFQGQIGNMLLMIYLHARKRYQLTLDSNQEVLWGGVLDHVRALFVRTVRDSLERCDRHELDYKIVIYHLERLEAKLTARAETQRITLVGDDEDELPSDSSDESWATYWNLTEADLEEYTAKRIATQKTIHGFWKSETRYVKRLTACMEDYQDELTREWLQVPVFQWIQEALHLIKSLKSLHEVFLHSLENRIKTQGPDVRELSDLIEQWLPKGNTLYGHYAQRLPSIEWKIKSYAAADSTFKGLFYTEANQLKWAKYIKGPSVRISSYTLLCDRILANAEVASEELVNFSRVLQEVQEFGKTFHSMQVRGKSAARVLQLDEAFVFKTKLPEVNSETLQLSQPSRQLFHEGEVQRVLTKKNEVCVVTHAFLFDKYLILAKQTGSIDAEKYEISNQPIPINLLMLTNSNNDVTWKASAITKVVDVNKDGGGNPKRVSNKSYDPSALYPFKIRHLGSEEAYILLVKTSEQRQEWWDKIKLAQAAHYTALQANNEEPYSLNLLSNGDFQTESSQPFNRDFKIGGSALSKAIDKAGPVVQSIGQTGVECATVSFRRQAINMIAIGAKTGFFVFQKIGFSRTPILPILYENVGTVTEIATILEFSATLVLGSNTLYAYDTMFVTGMREESVYHNGKKLLDNVQFFRVVGVGASKFVYCVLRPDRLGASVIVLELYKGEPWTSIKKKSFRSPSFSSRGSNFGLDFFPLTFNPGGESLYRKHDEFRLTAHCSDLVIFSETIVILTDRAFELMALKNKLLKVTLDFRGLQKTMKLTKTVGNRRPLGLFRLPEGTTYQGVSEYFICVYEDCAIHIDQNADITRNTCIAFTSPATSATLDSHYLFLFHTEYLEIRNVITGELRQIIAGQNIRRMEDVKSGSVLMAMQHPDVQGRELILECVLDDERTRMREGKGELWVRDRELMGRKVGNSRRESVGTEDATSSAALKGSGRRGVDEGEGERDHGEQPGGSKCSVM